MAQKKASTTIAEGTTTKTAQVEPAKVEIVEKAKIAEPAKTEVIEEVKEEPVLDEAVKAEETEVPDTKKTASKKTTERKRTPRKTTTRKTTVKTEEAKAPAKREPVKVQEVYVQFGDKEVLAKNVLEEVKKIWTKDMGNKARDLKEIKIYIKLEESAAYYVLNGEVTGKVNL